jgi:hypothetical protein
MKTVLKILIVGAITTACRLIFQLLIPDTGQTVLPPSGLVVSGTLPIVFSVYGLFVYSVLTASFLLVRQGIAGAGVIGGLKFGLTLCVLWTVYLFEPLPHATSIMQDSIAYVLADGAALLIMGLLAGLLLTDRGIANARFTVNTVAPSHESAVNAETDAPRVKVVAWIAIPAIVFVAGRLLLYVVFGIYSSFADRPVVTIVWCVATGIVSAGVVLWLGGRAGVLGRFRHPLAVGCAVYALNIVLFNGFMLLVFDFSKLDLGLRTGIDVVAVSLGCAVVALLGKR